MTVRVRTMDVGAGMGGAVLGMAVLPKETDGVSEGPVAERRCRLRCGYLPRSWVAWSAMAMMSRSDR